MYCVHCVYALCGTQRLHTTVVHVLYRYVCFLEYFTQCTQHTAHIRRNRAHHIRSLTHTNDQKNCLKYLARLLVEARGGKSLSNPCSQVSCVVCWKDEGRGDVCGVLAASATVVLTVSSGEGAEGTTQTYTYATHSHIH